ncbi:MAG: DUF5606 domain-containing protein [Bacteroidales bacterium]|jgi:hypothetical protein|nr:DUF5606 domain-containing protein [Bacteroidales bacterium]NLD64006.1 DUF5606 domain-containing protein [Bacteroidales bacterium]
MNLKDILSISGEGTLFKFIAQGKNAVIVENLETGRRFSAGATARVSALDEISIFTTGEDMPLSKVMDLIFDKEEGGEAVSHKQPDADLKSYFAEVMPDYDRDRVYTSDIRKVLHWYNILHKLNLLVKEEEQPEEKEEEKETVKPESDAAPSTDGDTGNNTETEPAKDSKPRKATAPKGGKAKPAEQK